MRDNRGFTLIELIVVMLIVGVLAIGSILGVKVLGFGSTQSTVKRIDSMLNYLQIENMTRSKPFYMIIEEADGKYFLSVQKDTIEISREELELVRGEITYVTKSGMTYLVHENEITGRDTSKKLEITFKKDTGGVGENRATPPETITKIIVSTNSRSYTIRLVEVTGKHYIE
ncbi:MAG TPA: prepilin-type N-terminal cleavage/methylation domain-containing protein [Mobilitalea sp.]|nr:prepilin-type N-terminal cleavage/methylation domain-containing protein [Mobilitalea sp.]